MNIFEFLRDWSEVWPLLIPLIIFLIWRPTGKSIGALVWYVFLAFVVNFWAIFILEYYNLLPEWTYRKGNNLFYNLHSFIMVIFFGWYLVTVRSYKYKIFLKALLGFYVILVIANFAFFEPFHRLSTRHFTVGSIILLLLCLFYFFSSIMEESKNNWVNHPSFIIVSAIFLYQAVTFFIFLFIYPLYDKSYNIDLSFAYLMMRVYQVIFIVFCIMLGIGLIKYHKQKRGSIAL